jgi:hypothetical protein
MTSPRKPRDVVSGLLDWVEEDEHASATADIDAELAAAGADVPAFLARLRTRISVVEEEERLRWREEARKKIAAHRHERTGRYDAYDHAALVAELARRQAGASGAQAFFHKLEELTDDDLRTLLEDQDALEGE